MPFEKSYAVKAAQVLLDQGAVKRGLFEEENFVCLKVNLARVPLKPSPKHHLMTIPHPLWKGSEVCAILSDKDVDGIKPRVKALGIPEIVKCISYNKLKTEHKPFEAKRKLVC